MGRAQPASRTADLARRCQHRLAVRFRGISPDAVGQEPPRSDLLCAGGHIDLGGYRKLWPAANCRGPARREILTARIQQLPSLRRSFGAAFFFVVTASRTDVDLGILSRCGCGKPHERQGSWEKSGLPRCADYSWSRNGWKSSFLFPLQRCRKCADLRKASKSNYQSRYLEGELSK